MDISDICDKPAETQVSVARSGLRRKPFSPHALPMPGIQQDQASEMGKSEIRKTTCYMCACRCGIDVHLRDGKIRYIEGNRDHPVNRGVLCAKGSAGIMQHYSPARLTSPLLRDGPRGAGAFREISWEEALQTAVSWLKPVREKDPSRLAFFTGRDQSQALTGWWAQQFGTPNFASHGGFCSVNMAAAGIYTIGGSFWEFGQPDWERTRLLLLFGVAEDHDSNPLKLGLSRLKARGVPIISVNPVRTGYSAIADKWIGIRPGTDGLLILSLIHELFRRRAVDLDYLTRYTNAGWLVRESDGLFLRDGDAPLVWDRASDGPRPASTPGVRPALQGTFTVAGEKVTPVFEHLAGHALNPEHAPESVSAETGVPAADIISLASELARVAFEESITVPQPWTDSKGERHENFIGRPVSMHAMRGISAHSNGFQTCRALHVLQLLLGSVDCPGGFCFKAPYPKAFDSHPLPCGESAPGQPMPGPPLGYPRGPDDLLVDESGKPLRVDKAFSWEAPLSAHGLMHMVIANAHAGDPYPVDVLFLYMANMSWNSSMNSRGVMEMLEARDPSTGDYRIPKIIYSDAYDSEMVAYADLILPDTTYLERHDCISMLDRPIGEPDLIADAIRWPVVEPDRDVRGFQSVLLDLGARLSLPGFVKDDGTPAFRDYADYMVSRECRPGVGPLLGWRGDGTEHGSGAPNPDQLNRYIANGGFWTHEVPEEARFFKHANRAWQSFAVEMGFCETPTPVTFQLYSEVLQKFRLAARDGRAPSAARHRMEFFDPLPIWYPPFEGSGISEADYPLHALTQRPMAMYHSWGGQNAWLRQIHGATPLYVPGGLCDEMDLTDGDWVWVVSHHGRIKVPVARMEAVNGRTVWTWNATGKRQGAWRLSPRAPESRRGFLLNHLIHELLPPKGDGMRWSNSDPITGQAAWFDLRVRLEKADAGAFSEPRFPVQGVPPGLPEAPSELRYGQEWTEEKPS